MVYLRDRCGPGSDPAVHRELPAPAGLSLESEEQKKTVGSNARYLTSLSDSTGPK